MILKKISVSKEVGIHLRDISRQYSVGSLHPHLFQKIPADFDATKYRRWVQLTPERTPKNNFLVMLYNLLLQHYLWAPVFGYLNQEYLDWQRYRLPLINATLRQMNCDIMFFQEMESQVYEKHWRPQFKNYDTLYIRKTPPKYWGVQPKEFLDGVGIFVKSERFTVEKSKSFLISAYIEQNPKIFKMSNDLKDRALSRNTVAIVAKLRDKLNGKAVYVSNSHLYWSPKFNDVKVLQMKAVLSALDDLIDVEDRDNTNMVIGGDFNSTPELEVFALLEGRTVVPEQLKCFNNTEYGIEKVSNPFNLSTAYEVLLKNSDNLGCQSDEPSDKHNQNVRHDSSGHCIQDNDHGDHHDANAVHVNRPLQFTAFTKALTAILDHIWYSNGSIQVNKILGEVDHKYCNREDVIGFPNNQFPSDHIPLVAKLEYKDI